MHLKALLSALLIATVSSHPFTSSNTLSAINTFYKTNRYKGAFLTCSIKGCTADLVAQYIALSKERKVDEKAREMNSRDGALSRLNPIKKARGGDLVERKKFAFDLRRSLMFLIYGGFYRELVCALK